MSQPNILLIITDQQRFDSLGCYGFEAAHTPNLDRLANQGLLFEHCYVNNPICTPSRASLMTGQHLPGHGVYQLYDNLPDDQVLFTEYLQQLGYHTALFGKLHVCSRYTEVYQRHPRDGFDVYEWCLEHNIDLDSPLNGYARWLQSVDLVFYQQLCRQGRKLLHVPREVHMTHWAAERTIDYIDNSDNPFFCAMSVFDPHNPYQDYPLEIGDLIDEEKIPDPFVLESDFEETLPTLKRLSIEGGNARKLSKEELRQMRFGYHASIALIDLEVGRVLEALDHKGIVDNTLVIFVSDHGDMLGDRLQMTKGGFFYDACVRVPLLMRWPDRFSRGRRVTSLVQLHDLAATILSAAGMSAVELQQIMPDAVDLIPACAGEADHTHDYAYCFYRNSSLGGRNTNSPYFDPPVQATMIRSDQFKMNLYHATNDAIQLMGEGQLFDMQTDPNEVNNLWYNANYADVRRHLVQQMMAFLIQQEVRYCGQREGEALPSKWRS